jgi:hypothetical protein
LPLFAGTGIDGGRQNGYICNIWLISSMALTPALNCLFEVNSENQTLLDKDRAFFHHNIAKLLFLCKRARSEIQMAVVFVCSTVKGPDKPDDYKKFLAWVMKNLWTTSGMLLIRESDHMNVMKWCWVDAWLLATILPDMTRPWLCGCHGTWLWGTVHHLPAKNTSTTFAPTP